MPSNCPMVIFSLTVEDVCYTRAMQPSLFFLMFAILILAGILILLVLKKKPQRIYKPKGDFLLSPGEKRFFDALTQSLPPGLYICPKVRIADLIDLHLDRNAPDFWKHQAPINQKHIDFIVVTRSDFAPQVAIELDGGSHTDKARAERDMFVDSVFSNAGIPLVHIPVKGFYQYADLRRTIEASITSIPTINQG